MKKYKTPTMKLHELKTGRLMQSASGKAQTETLSDGESITFDPEEY